MVQREEKTELGSIKIHNEVIGSVASLAACEVKGVVKIGGSLAKGIYDLISKQQFHKGVKIENLNENEIKITVYVVVEYGVNIPQVAAEVQENVRKNVEKMTGLSLAEVDVNIQGVMMSAKKSQETKDGGGNESAG